MRESGKVLFHPSSEKNRQFDICKYPGVLVYVCNPSIQQVEVGGQCRLHNKKLTKRKKKN